MGWLPRTRQGTVRSESELMDFLPGWIIVVRGRVVLMFPNVWSTQHMEVGVAMICYGEDGIKRNLQKLKRHQWKIKLNDNKKAGLRC